MLVLWMRMESRVTALGAGIIITLSDVKFQYSWRFHASSVKTLPRDPRRRPQILREQFGRFLQLRRTCIGRPGNPCHTRPGQISHYHSRHYHYTVTVDAVQSPGIVNILLLFHYYNSFVISHFKDQTASSISSVHPSSSSFVGCVCVCTQECAFATRSARKPNFQTTK